MSSRLASLLVALVLAGCGGSPESPALAAPGETAPPNLARATGSSLPLADLPKNVTAPKGRFTLWADFNTRGSGAETIQLYLVNRTGKPVDVPAQDGDVYAKLEVKSPKSGEWMRAQSHRYSDCGNSYVSVPVPDEHFVVVDGWRPAHGTEARVRYKLYEDLEAVSNEQDGFFAPAEVERARLDPMAIDGSRTALLREVLFGASAQHGPEQVEARRAALRRLRELRGDDVVNLLEELLAQKLDASELRDVLSAYRAAAPDKLSAYLLRALATGPAARAEALLAEMRFVERLKDKGWLHHLIERARDPSSAGLSSTLEILGGTKLPEIAALLVEVERDARYAEPIRILARYEHEQWFGDAGIDLRVSPRGSWSDGHAAPVIVDVTLVNKSNKRVDVSYSRPTDLLSLYLTREVRGNHTFLPPKKGVVWFTKPSTGPRKEVALAPGGEHTVTVAVMDYFDVPSEKTGLTVWSSVRVDGVQSVAKLGGGGAGINPR